MPGDAGEPVVTNSYAFLFCMRGCGCIEHPAFPTPSEFQKALQFAKLGRLAARSRRCVNCPDVIACSTTASAVFIPPTRGEGKQIVSGANDVQGGGLFVCMTQPHPALRATPRASFARLDPIKKGRDKKEQASLATMGNAVRANSISLVPPKAGKWIHFRSAMAQPRWPAILKTPCSRHRSRNSRRCDKTMPCSSDKRQCRRNHRARRNAALEFAASHWPRTSRCP
jgi:hypothetical protein